MSKLNSITTCGACRFWARSLSKGPCSVCYPTGNLRVHKPRNEDIKAEVAKVIDRGGKEIDRINRKINREVGELRALCTHTYEDGRSSLEPYGYYHNRCPLCDEMVEVPEEEVNKRITEAQARCQERYPKQ